MTENGWVDADLALRILLNIPAPRPDLPGEPAPGPSSATTSTRVETRATP
jgi:hypothetical protein